MTIIGSELLRHNVCGFIEIVVTSRRAMSNSGKRRPTISYTAPAELGARRRLSAEPAAGLGGIQATTEAPAGAEAASVKKDAVAP